MSTRGEGGKNKSKGSGCPDEIPHQQGWGVHCRWGWGAGKAGWFQVLWENGGEQGPSLESEVRIGETCPRPHGQASPWTLLGLFLNVQFKLSRTGSRGHGLLCLLDCEIPGANPSHGVVTTHLRPTASRTGPGAQGVRWLAGILTTSLNSNLAPGSHTCWELAFHLYLKPFH